MWQTVTRSYMNEQSQKQVLVHERDAFHRPNRFRSQTQRINGWLSRRPGYVQTNSMRSLRHREASRSDELNTADVTMDEEDARVRWSI